MSRICALTAATASASGTHPWIGAAPTGQMPGGIAHRQRWSSKRSLSSSLRTMPWTGFHRREARDLPWAAEPWKNLSLERKNPGALTESPEARLGAVGPLNFSTTKTDRTRLDLENIDSRGDSQRAHRWRKARVRHVHSLAAKDPFPVSMARLYFHHRSPFDGILTHCECPLTNAFVEGLMSVLFAAEGKAWGYRSLRNLRTMLPFKGPPLQLLRRAPFHKNQVEILCSALFRFPRKSSAVTSPQRAVRKGERETRWPEIPPHPTRRPSTGPIPKTHLPTGNSKDMPSAEEFRQHDARHGTPQSRHKPWNLLKPPQAKDSPGLVAGHESPRQVAGHESPRQVAGHESPTSGRTAGRGPTTCQRAAPGNFPMNKPHPEPKPPSPPKTPKPAPQPSAPPEPPLMNPTTLR